jgi:hypothetical protein
MKYLSQRDPKWAADKLGESTLTIGRWGCTTTAISMLSDYFNCYQSPLDIAKNVHNYTSDGLIIWGNLSFDKMDFVRREYGRNDTNLHEALKHPDKAVILQVNNGAHWVTAARPTKIGSDYVIIDPWDGTKTKAIARYHNITGAAYFERNAVDEGIPKVDPRLLYKGRLSKVEGNPDVWFCTATARHLIPDWTTFTLVFGGHHEIDSISEGLLNKFELGEPFTSLIPKS